MISLLNNYMYVGVVLTRGHSMLAQRNEKNVPTVPTLILDIIWGPVRLLQAMKTNKQVDLGIHCLHLPLCSFFLVAWLQSYSSLWPKCCDFLGDWVYFQGK